jgi:hypothetical protein
MELVSYLNLPRIMKELENNSMCPVLHMKLLHKFRKRLRSLVTRTESCVEVNGRYFQHLL